MFLQYQPYNSLIPVGPTLTFANRFHKFDIADPLMEQKWQAHSK